MAVTKGKLAYLRKVVAEAAAEDRRRKAEAAENSQLPKSKRKKHR